MKCWCGGEAFSDSHGEGVCLDSKFHDPLATGRPIEINKLYLAGPMSGYPECNYPLFNRVAETLRHKGYDVVNPAEVHIDKKRHYVDLIREDLKVMLDCDAVATLPNWWESVGARNEVNVAGVLKMPVRSHTDWLLMDTAAHRLVLS